VIYNAFGVFEICQQVNKHSKHDLKRFGKGPMSNLNFNRQLSRRTVLRGTGVAMSLPWISAMQPAFAAGEDAEPPRRFVAMALGLGLLGENLNPKEAGRGYTASRSSAGLCSATRKDALRCRRNATERGFTVLVEPTGENSGLFNLTARR
jgi:hypothetical protein